MSDFDAAEAHLAAALTRLQEALAHRAPVHTDETGSDNQVLIAERDSLKAEVASLRAELEQLRTHARREIDAALADIDAVLKRADSGPT